MKSPEEIYQDFKLAFESLVEVSRLGWKIDEEIKILKKKNYIKSDLRADFYSAEKLNQFAKELIPLTMRINHFLTLREKYVRGIRRCTKCKKDTHKIISRVTGGYCANCAKAQG